MGNDARWLRRPRALTQAVLICSVALASVLPACRSERSCYVPLGAEGACICSDTAPPGTNHCDAKSFGGAACCESDEDCICLALPRCYDTGSGGCTCNSGPATGPAQVGSCSRTPGFVCCLAGDPAYACTCNEKTKCTTYEHEVESCTADMVPHACSEGSHEVEVCSVGAPADSSSDPPRPTCTDVGTCDEGQVSCKCGTSCQRIGIATYVCAFWCNGSGCAGVVDPITGETKDECTWTPYDSYCN